MSEVQTATTAAVGVAPRAQPTHQRHKRTRLHQCLVLSINPQRRKRLVRAAEEQGWETIVALDAEDAAREAVRNRIQLAIVDLESLDGANFVGYRELVEQLAAGPTEGPLLMVCGSQEDVRGEIWARQLGVWMYLPGIDSHSDLAMLCGEARNAVDNVHASKVSKAN